MSKHKRIFIIGHSGAGKGVFGEALAKKLGWLCINTDFALATSVGRTVTELLGKQGEEAFQQCLSDVLSHQLSKENIVVVTDDSIVSSEKNRKILKAEFTINLKVSTPIQFKRLSNSRPFLPVADYKAFLDKLHKERDHWYEESACFSLSTDINAENEQQVKAVIDEHVMMTVKALEQ